MLRKGLSALTLTCCILFGACSTSMNNTPQFTSGVPMSLSMGDTPPSGVAVLFFEALITGASLQPSDMTKPAVSVMSAPVEVEFSHLQTDIAFLSFQNVPPGTYKSITLTFGNAALTVVNHSPAGIGSCASNAVCEMSPSFNPSTATLSSAPFPVTINANSVVGIRLDFNLNGSVQSDLSINPMVSITKLTQRQDGDDKEEMEEMDEIEGQVTGTATNQFMLMNERSGQSFTINVESNTRFEDFARSGCTATPADISCVKTGQILEVTLTENGMGTMLAKRVEFEEGANKAALKGTITSVNGATEFHMVVFNEEPTVAGVSEGAPVDVMIAPNAVFQLGLGELGDDSGFALSGFQAGPFRFASGADLLVGQDVQIRPASVSTAAGVTTVTTDLVRLWSSQVSGTVGMLNTDGTFTLTGLSPLFTGATPPITTINVMTLTGIDFMDFPGSSSVAAGNAVSVRGLLFNTTPTPTLVTLFVRDHNEH